MTDRQPMAPTVEDPTADGRLCGSRRSPRQIEQERENGVSEPWGWCRLPAGWGTDHQGVGRCKLHAGNTPNVRKSARVQLADLAAVAIRVAARTLAEAEQAASRWRAANPDGELPRDLFDRLVAARHTVSDVLDRAGYPRRTEVSADDGREALYERLLSLQQSEEASS